ncbi:MAG: glycoside hydrolase family 3 C-terminal domain-containing protein [Paracoccus sp. (in: a-proteobacteria)]|nr:glycoside hydrolase family 3 C-terminal domain-containing protein [Paracoccus sp. (in: a-proteobacteria)]
MAKHDEIEFRFSAPRGAWVGWEDDWAAAERLVARMTLEEKVGFVSVPMGTSEQAPEGALGSAAVNAGLSRLGIPMWDESDASMGVTNPNGIRAQEAVTAFPSLTALGATFCRDAARDMGAAVGAQSRHLGFSVQLAGGMNLIREPRGGRIFEYLGEDVLHSGILAGASVAGVQSQGVVSTLKHYAINPEETGRVMISSDITEKVLRESDLLSFQIAIGHGQPRSIMPGYNLVNRLYASESAFLLNTVLKGDWGFKGFVMSDWGATHSTEHAAWAGLDRQSGWDLDTAHYFGPALADAVRAGRISEARLDDMVIRILAALHSVGALEERRTPRSGPPPAHLDVARRVAEQSIVLLKNDGVLPLDQTAGSRIAVLGATADLGILSGGGSSTVTPPGHVRRKGLGIPQMEFPRIYHAPAPLDAIRARFTGCEVVFLGDDPSGLQPDDTAVVFAEKWACESQDAADLSLDGEQDDLIARVASQSARTVVVLVTPGAVAMPWLGDVSAVLAAWYGGTAGAEAICAVLAGDANPSGRLPVSFPARETDLPRPPMRDPHATTSVPGQPRRGGYVNIDYDIEAADVGYRWHAREGRPAVFPFGFGLSYTRFSYEDVDIAATADGVIEVALTVTNTGDRAGIDTPQVYVAPPPSPDDAGTASVFRLTGWARVALRPGESARVRIICDEVRLIASYDPDKPGWTIMAGDYAVKLARDAAAEPDAQAVVALNERRLPP